MLIRQTLLLPVCVQRHVLSALICASVLKKERRSRKVVVQPPVASLLLSCDLYSPFNSDKDRQAAYYCMMNAAVDREAGVISGF